MSNISLGLNFIVTGMVVVFITLAVMSGAMWVVGKVLGGKKKRPASAAGEESQGPSRDLSEVEIAAVSVAVHEYLTARVYGTGEQGMIPVFEPLDRWKMNARIESLERYP